MQSVQKGMDFITNYKPFTTRPRKDFLPWLSSVDERIAKENILSTRLVEVLRLAAGVLCRKKSLITKTLRVHLSLQRREYLSSIFKSCFTKMAKMWALPVLKPPKQINLKAAAFSRNCTIRCNAGVENCQINVWSTTNSRSIRKNGTVRFFKKILWLKNNRGFSPHWLLYQLWFLSSPNGSIGKIWFSMKDKSTWQCCVHPGYCIIWNINK